MKRAAKAFGVLLGIIATLIAVSALLVSLLFDPNQYKSQISKLVTEKTGRQFAINGELDFNIFPWIGLKAKNVVMGNVAGFSDGPFATVEGVKLRVRVLPLLHKQLEIGKITLKGVTLHLVRNEKGATNWQDLLPHDSDPAMAPQPVADNDSTASATVAALTVGGVNLEKSKLVWDDILNNRHLIIYDLSIRSGRMVPGKDFDIRWEFNFLSNTMGISGHCLVNSSVNLDLSRRKLRLQNFAMVLDLQESPHLAKPVRVNAQAQIDADFAKQHLNIRDLQVSVLNLIITGQLYGKRILENPVFTGELDTNSFDLKELLRKMGRAPWPTADPDVLKKIAFQTSLLASASQLQLTQASLVVDDSMFEGNLFIKIPKQGTGRFELFADKLDLDRYLPPAQEKEQPKQQITSQKSSCHRESFSGNSLCPRNINSALRSLSHLLAPTIATAVAESSPQQPAAAEKSGKDSSSLKSTALASMTWKGRINIASFQVHGIQTQNLSAMLSFHNRILRIESLRADLYGGFLTGDASINQQLEPPRWKLGFTLKRVDLDDLVKDTRGKSSIAGIADLNAKLRGTGTSKKAMLKNLDGNLKLKIINIKTAGLDIRKVIENGSPRLKGRLPQMSSKQGPTRLDELTASAKITKGVLVNKDLAAHSKDMRLRGEGRIDFRSQTVDYLLIATIKQHSDNAQNRYPSFLVGVPLPIRVTGPLSGPIISLNLRDLFKNAHEKKTQRRHPPPLRTPRERRERLFRSWLMRRF